MCILGFAVNVHPEFPVIICDNRDEYLLRPTRDAELELDSQILCGRDLAAGGTWCGLHTLSGHFAVLTNVFEPSAIPITNNITSRGKLVEMFIKGEFDLTESDNLLPNWKDFMGFNLLFGNVNNFIFDQKPSTPTPTDSDEPALYFISNRSSTGPGLPETPKLHKLHNGVHCVSNSFLDDLEWPKVKFLRDEIERVVTSEANKNASAQDLCDQLAQLLTARPMFPADQVQQYIIDATVTFCNKIHNKGSEVVVSENSGTVLGLNEMVEETLDSCQNIFVDYANKYKTKSQTIMLVHRSGKVHYFYRNTDDVLVPVPLLPFSQEMKEKNVASVGWKEFVLDY